MTKKNYFKKRVNPKKVTDDNHKAWSPVIFNQIDDGLVLIDQQKTIVAFNQAAGRLSGWESQAAIGLDFETVINLHNEAGPGMKTKKYSLELGEKARNGYRQLVYLKPRPPAAILPVIISLAAVAPPEDLEQLGYQNLWLIVLRDHSEEHARNQAKTDFVSTASHEMRTPLATIEGYLSLASNGQICQTDQDAKNYIEQARQATLVLSSLFRDLLTASQSEDGQLSNHPQVVDLKVFLTDLLANNDFNHKKEAVSIELQIGPKSQTGEKVVLGSYDAWVDPGRLLELLSNIIDNAIKYSQEGPVKISLTGDQESLQIVVADQGIGIGANDLPHLFQKFYRVDNNVSSGSGLGLFICQQIVDLFGGKIWVESQIGQGSQFYIKLPRLDEFSRQRLLEENDQAQPN